LIISYPYFLEKQDANEAVWQPKSPSFWKNRFPLKLIGDLNFLLLEKMGSNDADW